MSGEFSSAFASLIETHEFPGVGPITVSIGYTRVAADDDGALAFAAPTRRSTPPSGAAETA